MRRFKNVDIIMYHNELNSLIQVQVNLYIFRSVQLSPITTFDPLMSISEFPIVL